MKQLLTVFCALLLGASLQAHADYPKLELANGEFTVSLYLPDAEKGFYRGPRFDWSGIIERVTYAGHSFYAPLYAEHDPLVHDSISGPAEEFGMYNPMGFAEAATGETFVKVGVGLLRKEDADSYQFHHQYEIAQAGEWQIQHGPDWVDFRQELDGGNGWAYRYHKRIELVMGQPELSISHRLENTGTKIIELDNYNHNFTIIDDVPFGPDYSVELPFATNKPLSINDLAWYRDNAIEVTKPLGEQSLWALLFKRGEDEGNDPLNNSALIRNNKTGASVAFKGDAPVTHFIFWAVERAACPEPFISVNVEPGKAQEWTSTYTFAGGNEN